MSERVISRRKWLAGTSLALSPLVPLASTTGLFGLTACGKTKAPSPTPSSSAKEKTKMHPTLPAIYVPHGGGPWPWVEMGSMSQGMEPLREYIQNLPLGFPERPKALLVISAHWEETVPTVQTGQKPPMLYDYYGFPKEAYELTWPAPGSPETAGRVRELLSQNKIESGEDASRGFDHGNFVVTKLMYPGADIPTLQLSLTSDLDPKRLLDIGRALAPLRNEGVLILGSGFSYHNMRGFMRSQRGDPGPIEDSKLFDDWLYETLDRPPSERETRLIEWTKAPRARECHPREEHLLPLMVCVGAAETSQAEFPYRTPILGTHTLAAHFA